MSIILKLLLAAALAASGTPAFAGKSKYRHRVLAYQGQVSQQDPAEHEAGVFGSDLVATARRYIGTNPTGRRTLWCGAFMDFVLKQTGHKGGGTLASAYRHYGRRISGPQVGAIAVMRRRGGGHVGVVSGTDANGNPIIISGNTWSGESGGKHTVLEQTYPRSRIAAYVVPD